MKMVLHRIMRMLNGVPFHNVYHLRGNRLNWGKSLLHKCKFDIIGLDNEITIVGGNLTNCRFVIRGNHNRIFIGDSFRGTNAEFWIEDNNNIIKIGDSCSFCGTIQLACIEGKKIEIGNDCLFSSNIAFRTGDSHSILDSSGNRINQAKDIVVSNHVWIGQRAMILKGATISENSIVGAGAIVSKEFAQSNVIVAGVPAKIVKQNVNWSKDRISC